MATVNTVRGDSMRRALLLSVMVIALLVSGQTLFRASAVASSSTGLVSVAVIMGSNPPNGSLGDRIQIQTMLENEGLVYQVVNDTEFGASSNSQNYQAILVVGSSQPSLNSSQLERMQKMVRSGMGLIWIGGNLPLSLYSILGVANVMSLSSSAVTAIQYHSLVTGVFNETIYSVSTAGASVEAYFIDGSGQRILPAETSFRLNTQSGLTYYFAYDAYSWWDQDPQTPWLRAYTIQTALDRVLEGHVTLRLNPYPDGFKSAFITRIEDVDPLHTGQDWLSRAHAYLNYYSQRNSSLSVALIPMYLDPTSGLAVGLGNESAAPLRDWLTSVVLGGGAIVQHGYTHQAGTAHTGASPEFYNPSTGVWMNESEQQRRILLGFQMIQNSLGVTPTGFIAPEYAADSDTYAALRNLGFRYVDLNNNTPYFGQYGYSGLINVPETMGYIPLNAPSDTQSVMELNLGMLYNMSAVALFFDHLYDNNSLKIGEDLLSKAMTLPSVWYPNTNTLASFWIQRLYAYNGMGVSQSSSGISVSLGRSYQSGLTLFVQGAGSRIMSVQVNGRPWSVFNVDQVILPDLPSAVNNITINMESGQLNSNAPYGELISVLALASSVVIVWKLPKRLVDV
ncbi:MAG: DUF2334 domain-containing protein [Thaumarchaeota archaeon]|nr:DUF2334 domain-containing protein [Nitrososphaerota archaeon]